MLLKERRLVLPARFESVRSVCDFVVEAAEEAGLEDQSCFHVELAVDEACTNIVEHAYGRSGEGCIEVAYGTHLEDSERFFVVRLIDTGDPFDPTAVPQPQIANGGDLLPVGGLGIHFMREMMDRVEFHFHSGWNELIMYKKLGQEAS
jgi:anti-sigma regulatory factor (Ser/Thr protein kinase)